MFSRSPEGRRGFLRGPLWSVFIAAALSAMVLCGCEESTSSEEDLDVEIAQQLVEEGFQLLAAALDSDVPDFSAPRTKFEQAKALDPDNMDANVGLVICEVGELSQNQQVLTAVGGIIPPGSLARIAGGGTTGLRRITGAGMPQTGSQVLSPGGWMIWMKGQMARVLQDQPPDLGPLQTVTENVIIPMLDIVILLLESVEAHPDWQLVLTPELTGMEDGQLEIDIADIYMLDGLVHALKAQLHFFVAYNLNVPDFSDTTSVKAALNQQDGTLLKLRSNGAANLGDTYDSLIGAITKLGFFKSFLEAETDDQTDDLIKIDPTGDQGPSSDDLEDVRAELEALAAILSGPHEITDKDINGDGEVTAADALTVDLSEYFNDPISDLKQVLPIYHWNSTYQWFLWDGWPDDFSSFVFPNPTLNGILPGLTTDAEFKSFFGITTFPPPFLPFPGGGQ